MIAGEDHIDLRLLSEHKLYRPAVAVLLAGENRNGRFYFGEHMNDKGRLYRARELLKIRQTQLAESLNEVRALEARTGDTHNTQETDTMQSNISQVVKTVMGLAPGQDPVTVNYRDLTTTTAGSLVGTSLAAGRPIIEASNPLAELGADVVTGLVGKYSSPYLDDPDSVVSEMVAEGTAATGSTPTFGITVLPGYEMRPHANLSRLMRRSTQATATTTRPSQPKELGHL